MTVREHNLNQGKFIKSNPINIELNSLMFKVGPHFSLQWMKVRKTKVDGHSQYLHLFLFPRLPTFSITVKGIETSPQQAKEFCHLMSVLLRKLLYLSKCQNPYVYLALSTASIFMGDIYQDTRTVLKSQVPLSVRYTIFFNTSIKSLNYKLGAIRNQQ